MPQGLIQPSPGVAKADFCFSTQAAAQPLAAKAGLADLDFYEANIGGKRQIFDIGGRHE